MNKKAYSRRLRAVRVANAVNKVEGVSITESARRLSFQWANGEITGDRMKSTLIAKHSQANKI